MLDTVVLFSIIALAAAVGWRLSMRAAGLGLEGPLAVLNRRIPRSYDALQDLDPQRR